MWWQSQCPILPFGIIDKLLHKSSSSHLLTYDNMDKLALDFATFFEDKISMIHNELIHSDSIDGPIADTIARSASIKLESFDPVSEYAISKIVQRSAIKLCSLDSIPTKLFKNILPTLVPIITYIVNKSLQTSSFPLYLKQAIIKPILKKPQLHSQVLNNYWPVSNLRFISKVIEKWLLPN